MQILITDDFIFHTGHKDNLPSRIKAMLGSKSLTHWHTNRIKKNSEGYTMLCDNDMMTVQTNQKVMFLEIT